MLVVHVLSDEGVRLHGAIGIHLRHVHVIYEIDESLGAWGAKVATWECTIGLKISYLLGLELLLK